MRRSTRRIGLFLALAAQICAAGAAGAQGGQHGAIVLELPASARALALSGAYAAASGDDALIFYNPGQLATDTVRSAGISVQGYLASSTLGAASAAMRLGRGTVGVGIRALSYGSEDEIVPDPAFGGERGTLTGRKVSAADVALSLGYGMRVSSRLRLGGAVVLVRQSIADVSGSAAGLDVGAGFDAPFGVTLGGVVQHLGTDVSVAGSHASLPRMVRLAATRSFRYRGYLITPSGELSGTDKLLGAAGLEAGWRSANGLAFVGRVGTRDRRRTEAAVPVTAGGGIIAHHLALDYAYEGFDLIGGATHRVGVRWWR